MIKFGILATLALMTLSCVQYKCGPQQEMLAENVCARINPKDPNLVDVAKCPEGYRCSGNHKNPDTVYAQLQSDPFYC